MTDQLAGFRGSDSARSPITTREEFDARTALTNAEPVEDGENPPAPAPSGVPEIDPRIAGVAGAQEETAPLRVDTQRAKIAERFRRDRAIERQAKVPMSHVPSIDGDNPAIPGSIQSDDLELSEEAAEERERRASADAARAALEQTPPPANYRLRVDSQEFVVNREELLRYAEVPEEEAGNLNDAALTSLAQKHLAALVRLREADELKDFARRVAAPGDAVRQTPPQVWPQTSPGDAVRQTPPQAWPQAAPQPRFNGQVPQELVDAVERIQLGDPQEGAKALAEVFFDQVRKEFAAHDQARASLSATEEARIDSEAFMGENPEITGNPALQSAHVALFAREVAEDLRRLGLINDHQYAAIATNPSDAAKIMTAARAEGYPVRRPREVFEAAKDKLAHAFAPQTTAQPVSQTPPVPTRLAEKRALLSHPASAGVTQLGTSAPTRNQDADREANRAKAMQQIRRARGLPT